MVVIGTVEAVNFNINSSDISDNIEHIVKTFILSNRLTFEKS